MGSEEPLRTYLEGTLVHERQVGRRHYYGFVATDGRGHTPHVLYAEESSWYLAFVKPYYKRLICYHAPTVSDLESARRLVGDALGEGGGDRPSSLKARLRDRGFQQVDEVQDPENYAVRAEGDTFRWQMPPSFLAQRLRQEIASDDESVQFQALRSLEELDNSKARDILIEALKNRNPVVQLRATEALRKVTRETLFRVYSDGIRSSDVRSRLSAVTTLAELADERAQSLLLEALRNDSDETVRAAAVAGLERGRSPEALPALQRAAVEDASEVVRQAAERALGRLQAADATN